MASKEETHLDLEIPYGGGVYRFHHCIERIIPPAKTGSILEDVQ
jgi:hypothetical protein